MNCIVWDFFCLSAPQFNNDTSSLETGQIFELSVLRTCDSYLPLTSRFYSLASVECVKSNIMYNRPVQIHEGGWGGEASGHLCEALRPSTFVCRPLVSSQWPCQNVDSEPTWKRSLLQARRAGSCIRRRMTRGRFPQKKDLASHPEDPVLRSKSHI